MPPVLRSINSKSGINFDDISNLPVDENLTSSETRSGLIQIANQTETISGANNFKAITPQKLKIAINSDGFIQDSSTTLKGLSKIATDSLADIGTDNSTIITPLQLKRQIDNFPNATNSVFGKIQIATNSETNTGTDNSKAITPSSLANRLSSFTIPGAAPTGSVVDFAGSTAPTGYLLCDGASYSTTTYTWLFAVIGYTFGGSGASFNVPDCRGRTSIGTGTGIGLTARTLAQITGEENHLLTTAEIPEHNHVANINIYTGITTDTLMSNSAAAYLNQTTLKGKIMNSIVSTANTGNSVPSNVMQPSIVFNKIIKT